MSTLGPGKEGNVAGGAVERHGGGRVYGCAVGTEKWAGSNKVVGEIFVLADVALHGLGFVREEEGTGVVSRHGECLTVGQGKTKGGELGGGEKVAEIWEAAAAKEDVSCTSI